MIENRENTTVKSFIVDDGNHSSNKNRSNNGDNSNDNSNESSACDYWLGNAASSISSGIMVWGLGFAVLLQWFTAKLIATEDAFGHN